MSAVLKSVLAAVVLESAAVATLHAVLVAKP